MNYEILYSLNNMKDISYKINALEYINKANIKDKINSIFNLYYGMNIYEIYIKYKVDKNEIRLFGNDFVQRYKNICRIIINGKEEELRELKTFSRFGKKIEQYEIKLRGIQNIDNLNHMFYNCESLLSLPDISKWNISNVTDMSYMFSWYKSLTSSSLPGISKWNTSNVTDMSYMFNGCESLSYLPDISKWDTSNVTNMSYMFSGCKSLYSLCDISKWNVSKVNNISYMFFNCNSLTSLTDISKWNLSKTTNTKYMFYINKSSETPK